MKTLPKFTYGRQFLDDSDIQAVTEALKADYITTGPLVKKFENELFAFLEQNFSVLTRRGAIC